jgi:hypothetical protein
LTLQPVNFEQLYAQRMQQLMNEQKQGGNGQAPAATGSVEMEETVSAEFPSKD